MLDSWPWQAPRRALAEKLGATETHDPGAGPITGGYDVVIECAGVAETVAQAVEIAAPGGTVVIFGVMPRGETAPLIPLGAATFVTYDPSGPMSGFTAMPLVIFNWVKHPQEEFQVLAAAGIIVLLAVLIAMNSFAIWLRNRYEQRW